MIITIDHGSRYCHGVSNAINKATAYLSEKGYLYCLGQIIHNQEEISRLNKMGLITINHEEFEQLSNETVLIRAHGEVVSTYTTARKNNIRLLDATCPIVKNLQDKVRDYSTKHPHHQVIIFGKDNHPESKGLASRAGNMVSIMQSTDNSPIDFTRPVKVFSQTTMDIHHYDRFILSLERLFKQHAGGRVFPSRSFCKYVSNRASQVRQFAREHDVILFVSDKNSSNGKYLFSQVLHENKSSYFITNSEDIDTGWFNSVQTIGITGAASTPLWLLEKIKKFVNSE